MTHPSAPVPRQKTLATLAGRMTLLGTSLALLGALTLVAGQRGQGELPSLLKGFGTGILAALPVFFAGMTLRMYHKMDEYAQQQLTQAASVAFMLTMLLGGALIALQAALNFNTPAWVFYATGMGAWLIASLRQHLRRDAP